jgi:hypothetical protein
MTFRITGFPDFIHRPQFWILQSAILRKLDVSIPRWDVGSLDISILRWGEGPLERAIQIMGIIFSASKVIYVHLSSLRIHPHPGFLSHISNIDTLKLIYFAYFHSLMKYGITFWGNSSDSKKVFTLQTKAVIIIVGTKPQIPCSDPFKESQILPLPCKYIFSLLNFVINNLRHFQIKSAKHCVNTTNKHNLQRPTANLTRFQKSIY